MLPGQNLHGSQPKVDPYLKQKIMSASPEQLISYIYDVAISACGREDRMKATMALQELINSLNFEHKEMAGKFFQLYRYILDLIVKGKFEDAKHLLYELKSTWVEAMKVV